MAGLGVWGTLSRRGLTNRRLILVAVATILVVVTIIAFLLLIWPFGAPNPSLSLSPVSARIQTSVTASGRQFPPGSAVALRVGAKATDAGKVHVGDTGTFAISFTVPDVQPGHHTVAVVLMRDSSDGQAATQGPVLATASLEVLPSSEAARTTPATESPTPSPSASPSRSPSPSPAATKPVATPRPATPTPRPTAPTSNVKILFGLGPQIESASTYPLARDAPIHMLSAWYNGPDDLGWMTDAYHQSLYRRQYAAGRSLHLIVWTNVPNATIATKYGTACGRPYPLSDRFLADISRLARAFAGSGRLYVTLFTEFQTFACTENAWNPDPETNAYWRALKDRYLAAKAVIRTNAPKARVSLGWGGWQTRWDEPAIGGGRSMIAHFADVMKASDFQSFQSMRSDSNVSDIVAMTKVLGAYGPVMLAHYKPVNESQAVYNADVRTLLTDSYMRKLRNAGLFAWSFMDTHNLKASSTTYAFVKAAIRKYGL